MVNAMIRLAIVVLATGVPGAAHAQIDWVAVPMTGPSLDAFVQPQGSQPGDAQLVLHCEGGGFVPMLKLGRTWPDLTAAHVWVETALDGQPNAGSDWFFDAGTGRALPTDTRHAVVISQSLMQGGTLRAEVTVGQGEEPLAYSFGLADFWRVDSQVPCLRALEESLLVTEWRWYPDVQRVYGGVPDDKGLVFLCTTDAETGLVHLNLGLVFSPLSDPGLPFLAVWIGAPFERPDMLRRVEPGFYLGVGSAITTFVEGLANFPEVMVMMTGAPGPYLFAANYPALVAALTNLPCADGRVW